MEVVDERNRGIGEKLKAAVMRAKGIKNFKIIAVLFIIAVALLIYSTVANTSRSSDSTVATQMNSDELRLSAILSGIEGAGDVEAMITQKSGEILGVLVIADGADSITVRLRLIEATAKALGVSKSIVSVYCRK